MSSVLEFAQTPSQALLCPICQDVYDHPYITGSCSHSFCKKCIQSSMQIEPSCPLCRSKLKSEELHPNLALSGLVSELLVHCPNNTRGCDAVVRLESLPHHLKECQFSSVACEKAKYGCSFTGLAKDLAEHILECPFVKLNSFIEATDDRISNLEQTLEHQKETIQKLEQWIQELLQNKVTLNHLQTPLSASTDSSSSSIQVQENWPLGEIQCRKTISSHRTGVTSLTYSNGLIYSGSYDGTTSVFNASSGEQVHSMRGHSLSVWSLAVNPNNNRIFSAGSDGHIKVWDMMSYNEITHEAPSQQQHRGKVYSLLSMGNHIYSASSDKTIKIWDAQSLECLETLHGHTDGLNSIAFIGMNRIASGSTDGTVKIWDMSTSQNVATIEGMGSEVLDVCSGGGMLFASTYDAKIHVFSLTDFSRMGVMLGHHWEIWKLQYTQNVLFSASFDHTIKRWDPRMFSVTQTLSGHKGFVHALSIGNNSLISGCADKTIKIWN